VSRLLHDGTSFLAASLLRPLNVAGSSAALATQDNSREYGTSGVPGKQDVSRAMLAVIASNMHGRLSLPGRFQPHFHPCSPLRKSVCFRRIPREPMDPCKFKQPVQ
jgi:hypothetical protein